MWLNEHIKNEVLPLLKIRNIRPAKAPTEAQGLLISAIKSLGLDKKQTYDCGIPNCPVFHPTLSDRWLELEQFYQLQQREFTPEEWEVIKNSIRSMKAKAGGARIILPGRDAFLWHMMLEKIGYPNLYDPRISRAVASLHRKPFPQVGWDQKGSYSEEFIKILNSWNLRPDDYIIDTGFMGTIPKAINAASNMNLRWSMLSADSSVLGYSGGGKSWSGRKIPIVREEKYKTEYDKQIFPNHKGSRELALKIEGLPKYQESARLSENGKIIQDASNRVSIMMAALFTIRAWYSY